MKIRRIRASDKEEIMLITKALPQWFTARGRKYIRQALNKHDGFVAYKKHILGFALYRKWKIIGELTWIGVLPEYHRKGIGTALVRSVEKELKKGGVEKVKVATLAQTVRYEPYERTRKFYSNMGFEYHKINKNFYKDKGERLDRLVLIKNL